MSNAIFPTYPGLDMEVVKEIEFNTIIQASKTGKELRVAQRAYPMYRLGLKFNFLRDTTTYPELRSLGGFYMSRTGPADSFLITDTDDASVTDQLLGTGNGTQVDFQALRTFGTFVEPVFNINAITNVKVNGSITAAYTLQPNGVIRMNVAPTAGQTVTWTGSYYFRARFVEDRLNLKKFLNQVWSGQSVPLIANLQDKIA